MIHLLDESLEDFLRQEVPLPQGGIDISFDTPDGDWATRITQPTLNVFFWDVRRSPQESRSGRLRVTEDGERGYKMAPPRVACRYLLTAWATDVRDEHSILSSVLAAMLPLQKLPPQYLKGALADTEPGPDLRTASANASDFVDFWSALQGKIKAGIDLVVNMTIDSGKIEPAGPLIGSTTVGSRRDRHIVSEVQREAHDPSVRTR